ncbi:MAG: pyridoxal phosphate-dependent aminotransferase [Oscillospiraceae bacterium]|nr:pyridoxal phosphate-dependent aminotransferase [Oscillospiraceae bacterium]
MVSDKMLQLGRHSSVIRDIFEYGNQRRKEIGAENVFDFSLGNPSVPAPDFVREELENLLVNTPAEVLHAYTSAAGDSGVRLAIADYIRNNFGYPAESKHIYMTVGAAASLTVTLNAIVENGDEVIAFAPYFPEYKVFAETAGAKFITVNSEPETFQIDAKALYNAINVNTKAVIVNSPNNPTGVVLTEDSIKRLADILDRRSAEFGHPIFLICDEPYRELAFGNAIVPYVPLYYKNTIVCYSFSKSLSLPGERIGYIYVASQMEEADMVFDAVCGAGRALGFVCAPAMFQLLVKRCLGKTVDISIYNRNRTLLFDSLSSYGFSAVYPDGAFYLFLKSPVADSYAFCEKAKDYELLLVPADDFGCPGYVRIAYCVGTEQIERSLPAFAKLASYYFGGDK